MNTVLIRSDKMGEEEKLGRKLMRSFFRKITLKENSPEKIVLYNSAVKLAKENSPVSEEIRILNEKGVDIVACGTCVNYFELNEKVKNIRIGNMKEISEYIVNNARVVTI